MKDAGVTVTWRVVRASSKSQGSPAEPVIVALRVAEAIARWLLGAAAMLCDLLLRESLTVPSSAAIRTRHHYSPFNDLHICSNGK